MWKEAKDFIPHERTMRFVDFIRNDTGRSIARGCVRNDNPLLTADGLPAHVGIEYMAQAIAGQRGLSSNESTKKSGVIVSIKAVEISQSHFHIGQDIEVFIEILHKDDVFEVNLCRAIQGEEVIRAEISVAEIAGE